MNYGLIANKYRVSKVGIGGHYSKMEEGVFEYNYAEINKEEIKLRTEMIEKAVDAGINYFDTTWRNESDMLAESIKPLNIRDKIFINGMVLGTFRGSKEYGLTPSQYLNKWLDDRLKKMPGKRFDSFMINAIEEDYNESECEKVIRTLETRKKNGDINIIGFSCHDHRLAREIAGKFSEFELIMTAYNFKNRSFEKYFGTYNGNASFVTMKPLIWYEYGVPFSRLNDLPDKKAEKLLKRNKVNDIASKAVRWNVKNNMITTCVCAVNSMDELTALIDAGNMQLTEKDSDELEAYRNAIESEQHIPYLISAILKSDSNRRSFFFGLASLAHALGYPFGKPDLNNDKSDELLAKFRDEIIEELIRRGYGEYLS